MLRSLEGSSEEFTQLPARSTSTSRTTASSSSSPIAYLLDLAAYIPGSIVDLVAKSPALAESIAEPLRDVRRDAPSLGNAADVRRARWVRRCCSAPAVPASRSTTCRRASSTTRRIERYLRDNLERAAHAEQLPQASSRHARRELYIVAMNLDTAERVVFGHDEDSSLSISEAVQASTALPGFYRPARIRGIDYVDGGVRRTANIDVAIEHGADLVICYNPFRPFSNRVVRTYDPQNGRLRRRGRPARRPGHADRS